ncbi:MAG: glutamyl-tRNA(Gln) amidotransferase, subunit [Thermoleophilia bacterium]|nr:glutamyl-tRNA(Gln) amidotransferase, subunit [Thermoleophilia bacterium]
MTQQLDLLTLTAAGAADLLTSGELSSAELADAYLDRIEADTDATNAFLHVDRAATRASVAHAETLGDAAGSARGVPLAIKDLLSTADMPTTCASKILEGFRPVYDATVVANARAAGLVNLGKVNMDEFAMGSSNETSAFGPVRNPWDPSKVPGGSSGGSAASVAGGFAPWALGTDTGGSIRQPAALCGIVGLKPTYGAVSRYGLVAFASSLDQVGPMTKNVEDCATLFNIIASPDARDTTCVGPRAPVQLKRHERLDGVRLGLPKQFMLEGVDPDVKAVIEENLRQAVELGAAIVDVDLPHAEYGLAAYYLIAPAEASANLARFDGVRYGHRSADADNLYDMYLKSRAEGFGTEVQRRIMIGAYALSSGYYDAYYGQAQKVRTLIAQDFAQVFEHCDLVVGPTSPTTAFGIGERIDDPLAMYASDICTIPVNLAALPAISIPSGLSGGLPVGLQLIGPAFSEQLILDVSWTLEQVFDFDVVPGRLRDRDQVGGAA